MAIHTYFFGYCGAFHARSIRPPSASPGIAEVSKGFRRIKHRSGVRMQTLAGLLAEGVNIIIRLASDLVFNGPNFFQDWVPHHAKFIEGG
jgi:hypothetical protein